MEAVEINLVGISIDVAEIKDGVIAIAILNFEDVNTGATLLLGMTEVAVRYQIKRGERARGMVARRCFKAEACVASD
jgi:hypothetical protein